jgi:hypothetical protein
MSCQLAYVLQMSYRIVSRLLGVLHPSYGPRIRPESVLQSPYKPFEGPTLYCTSGIASCACRLSVLRSSLTPVFLVSLFPRPLLLSRFNHHRVAAHLHHAIDAGMNPCAKLARFRGSEQIAFTHAIAAFDHCNCRRARMLLQRQRHLARRETVLLQRLAMSLRIGTRRYSPIGCGSTESGVPVHVNPRSRATGFDCTQTVFGSRSSGQANIVHRLHSQQ